MFLDGVDYDEIAAEGRSYRAEEIAEVEAEERAAVSSLKKCSHGYVVDAGIETCPEGCASGCGGLSAAEAICPRHGRPEIAPGACNAYAHMLDGELLLLAETYEEEAAEARETGDTAEAERAEAGLREARVHQALRAGTDQGYIADVAEAQIAAFREYAERAAS